MGKSFCPTVTEDIRLGTREGEFGVQNMIKVPTLDTHRSKLTLFVPFRL